MSSLRLLCRYDPCEEVHFLPLKGVLIVRAFGSSSKKWFAGAERSKIFSTAVAWHMLRLLTKNMHVSHRQPAVTEHASKSCIALLHRLCEFTKGRVRRLDNLIIVSLRMGIHSVLACYQGALKIGVDPIVSSMKATF